MSIWTALTGGKESEEVDGYHRLEELVRERTADLGDYPRTGPLFTTDASGLFGVYLDALSQERRQHYNCRSCEKFIETYGSLVRMDTDGQPYAALWYLNSPPPPFFQHSISMLKSAVEEAKVTGVFYSSEPVWGRPQTEDLKRGTVWTHLSGVNSSPFSHPLKTADQAMAERREEFKMLLTALGEYPQAAVEESVRVLRADALTRSEKAQGVAEWLLDLHKKIGAVSTPHRTRNLVWAAVATAPPGFAHVRSTVISTLLDDIVAGLPYESVKKRWAEKLHPLQYQRPSAPPSEGSIDQAEKAFEKLGASRSLLRRYATLGDIQQKLWVSTPPQTETEEQTEGAGGLFRHLRKVAQEVKQLELPPKAITWEKFRTSVLPSCRVLEANLPAHGNFYGLVTAEDPEAPPVLQWDGLVNHPRNPVSWYVYNGGSSASNWFSLDGDWGAVGRGGIWVRVSAVFLGPSQWQEPDKFKHQGERVAFALEGCKDKSWERCGLGLFPETLKSEYHAFRSVIEAHSSRSKISGHESGNANGLLFQKEGNVPLTLRADGQVYTLDRWE